MKNVIYVTGNKAKIESARHALEPLGFKLIVIYTFQCYNQFRM